MYLIVVFGKFFCVFYEKDFIWMFKGRERENDIMINVKLLDKKWLINYILEVCYGYMRRI